MPFRCHGAFPDKSWAIALVVLAMQSQISLAQPPCCIINMSFERTAGSCFGANCGCTCTPNNFALGDTWFSCPGWGCGSTDIGPNPGGDISMGTTAPTQGNTFLSMTCNGGPSNMGEGIAMGLCTGITLTAGTQYCFSIDLITRNGLFGAGNSRLRIFGSAFACQTTELLYDSPALTGAWQTYNFCFTPTGNWAFLNFRVVNATSGFHALGLDRMVSTDGNFPPQPPEPCLLPVVLVDFSGEATAQGNEVRWSTASEASNARFIVEKSRDGIEFQAVGEVAGAGDAAALQQYRMLDHHDVLGTRYYRLVQIDTDERRTLSKVITVLNQPDSGQMHAYFDPILGSLVIHFGEEPIGGSVQLAFKDGRIIKQVNVEGITSIIPAVELPDGIYLVHATLGQRKVVCKVILQR